MATIAEYFEVSIDELFKPSMTAYRNKEAILLAIYEVKRSTEDFNRADQAYQKLIASSDNYNHEDLRLYACLLGTTEVKRVFINTKN